jgi:two-component system OmpR family response regulator
MADLLVIDDDPSIRTILTVVLVDEGHTVRVATDGVTGLLALKAGAPDCLIVDMMMPNIDGLGLLAARRRLGLAPRTKVIILTCNAGEADRARGWALGADDYITKPFDVDLVAHRVVELLATAPAGLAAHRQAELHKAELLDRIETAFQH